MISEDEFMSFQTRMNAVRKETFNLKEKVKELMKTNAEYQSLKTEVENLEKQKADSKKRHQESLALVQEEISSLKQKLIQLKEQNETDQNNQFKDLTDKIETHKQKIEVKESKIAMLTQNNKKFETRFIKKKRDLDQLRARCKKLQPVVDFLQTSRSYPMYLEDLKMQKRHLLSKLQKLNDAKADLIKRQENLDAFNRSIAIKIQLKNQELSMANSRLEATKTRIQSAEKEIAQTQDAIAAAKTRLDACIAENQAYIEQQEQELKKYTVVNDEYTKQLNELTEQYNGLVTSLDDQKKKLEDDKVKWKQQATELRKIVIQLKDTGIDPSIPRIDVELQKKIEGIIFDKERISKHMAQLRQDIQGKKNEIDTIEFQIQNQTLKQQPTLQITQSPDFQQKQLLLEELIIQNVDLNKQIVEFQKKIQELKSDSDQIRKSLQKAK